MKTFRSKLLVGLASAAALSASAAQAAITFDASWGGDFGPPAGYQVVYDYDGTASFFTESGDVNGAQAAGSTTFAQPTGASGNFTYVSTGQSYVLDGAYFGGFSVFIGSIDDHNSIGFYNGGSLVQSFGGWDLVPGADGDQFEPWTNRRFTFDFNGAAVNRVVFSAGGDSMEWDTIAINPVSAVPEPATWAMMITGFGLMGAALRRRRRLGPVAA